MTCRSKRELNIFIKSNCLSSRKRLPGKYLTLFIRTDCILIEFIYSLYSSIFLDFEITVLLMVLIKG